MIIIRILIAQFIGGTQITPLQLFKLLSDETRLNIVLLLNTQGELCVCDIYTALSLSQPKTSRHLALMREQGLLLDIRKGKWIHYRLSPHLPAWANSIIEQACHASFAELNHLLRNLEKGSGCK